MKTFGIIHILILLLAILACKCVNAQDFLVTTKGDTLSGDIKPLNYGPEKKVQVKGTDNKKTVYSMFQVAFYSLNNELFYPVKGPVGFSFMKLLKGGYLSLYGFQAENQVTYDGRYLLKKDGKGTEVPNLSFKKTLTNFLKDCEEVSVQINDGLYSKKDLEKIVDDYNACIISKTSVSAPVPSSPTMKKVADSWNVLSEKVKALENFSEKENVLEMISEVKSKISRSEKVPNFLIAGIKESLTDPALQEELDKALKDLNP